MTATGAAPGNPSPPDGNAGINLVRCRAASHDFALPAARVLGLASAGDPTLPSLAALLGLPEAPAGTTRSRMLCVAVPTGSGGGGVLSLRVEEPVAQLHLPASAIHPVPALIAARLNLPHLRALALTPAPATLLLILVINQALPATLRHPWTITDA